ncbi:TetR/AcrR family transcriptional regulator [Gordonia terrae]|uniref:TetR/AcrR family transcriptional regulator n=1 Tax=Gordonia terrae TaxID=2055 RepID=UPI003F6C04A9
MDAAEVEMGTRGVGAVSIADLVSASGCPNGTLYYHFGSKTGLLAAVLERGFRRVHSDVAAAMTPAVSDAEATIVFYEAVARSVDSHPDFHRLVVSVFLNHLGGDEIGSIVEPFRQALLRDGAEQIRTTLAERGHPTTPEHCQDLATSLNAWLMGLFILGAPDIPSRVRAHVDALIEAAIRHTESGC